MKRFFLIGLFLLLAISVSFAASPQWWSDTETKILDAEADAENFAPANLGQLKYVAKKAKAHLDARLPGGSGSAITNLVNSFEPRLGQSYTQQQIDEFVSDNYSPINLGQLKAVAKPFYTRLQEAGYDTKKNLINRGYPSSWAFDYPWDPQTPIEENYAPANLGQLKMVFSFDLLYDGDVPPNGIPDWWEEHYFGHSGVDPSAMAPAGGGFTILDAFTLGFDPITPLAQIEAPVITPGGRRLSSGSTVDVISSTPGAVIRYTIDGSEPSLSSPVVPPSGEVSILGTTVLKVRAFKSNSLPVFAPSDVVRQFYLFENLVSAGNDFTIFQTLEGALWAWGRNGTGQLGRNSFISGAEPQQVVGLSGINATASGWDAAFALGNDGNVYAWGDGLSGSLGTGTLSDAAAPASLGLRSFSIISGGQYHAVSATPAGDVWAWGDNSGGQLGITGVEVSLAPVQLSGIADIIDVKAGAAFTLALSSDGTLFGWGDNRYGQIGAPIQDTVSAPTEIVVGAALIKSIAIGAFHSLALDSEGDVYAWGVNWNGQLGTGTRTGSAIPTRIVGLPKIVHIAAGKYHSLAIAEGGVCYVWGANWSGQIGNGTTEDQLTPVQLNFPNVVDIAGGVSHSVAITADGKLWAWGSNTDGQLGVEGPDQTEPSEINGLRVFEP